MVSIKRKLQDFSVVDRIKIKSILRILNGKSVKDILKIIEVVKEIVQVDAPVATSELAELITKDGKLKKDSKP